MNIIKIFIYLVDKMLTNDYSMAIQLSTNSSKYYDADLHSNKTRKGFEHHEPVCNHSTCVSEKSVSNICDTFVRQEQSCNLNVAFCVAPVMQLTIPPPPHNSYTYNSANKTNEWQGNTEEERIPRDKSKGVENVICHRGYRFSYENPFYNNNCRYDNTELFCSKYHRSSNTYNRNRLNNGKKQWRDYKHRYSEDIDRRVHGLMERFTARSKLFKIEPLLSNAGKPNPLDQSIWDLFYTKAQSEVTYLHKLDLWKKLFLHITKLFDRFGLFMVGSTMSGLGTKDSDIDMCLLLRSCLTDTRADAVHYLDIIRNSLLNCGFVQTPEVIHAKVPILKFKTTRHGFEVDLNCNNAVGIRNTHLLHCYTQLDWRVRPLVVVVKLWAQTNGINDAKNMTISSYSLALMVIHFLQCGVIPPVVPCLHGLYPDKFNPEKEIHDIDIQEELPSFLSDNQQTLGELLQGFLYYYATFNYEMYAISVRIASRILVDECRFARSLKNDPHQWKYLCIEEPFDLTNTARSVYDLPTFKRIQRVFQVSSNILIETENLSCILMNTYGNQR